MSEYLAQPWDPSLVRLSKKTASEQLNALGGVPLATLVYAVMQVLEAGTGIQLTLNELTGKIIVSTGGVQPPSGIGSMVIGSTFVVGGSSPTTDGIGHMAIGSTFVVGG